MLLVGLGSVRIGKNCDLRLENAALGLRPWAAFSRPRSQFIPIRTSQPANNIYFRASNWERGVTFSSQAQWFYFHKRLQIHWKYITKQSTQRGWCDFVCCLSPQYRHIINHLRCQRVICSLVKESANSASFTSQSERDSPRSGLKI